MYFVKYLFNSFLIIDIASCYSMVNILETTDQKIVEAIFREYGIVYPKTLCGKVKHICNSIDGKSNRIFGDMICDELIRKYEKIEPLKIKRTECVEGIFPRNIHVTNRFQSIIYQMVKCTNPNTMENLYITNGPKKNFFYVYKMLDELTKTTNVIGCFEAKIQKNFIHKIKPNVTLDKVEADDIFGIYGSQSDKKKTSQITAGESFCRKIMNMDGFKEKFLGKVLQTPIKFEKFVVARRFKNFVYNVWEYKKRKPIHMIKCDFKTTFFGILKGPENLYFIAEKSDISEDDSLVHITASITI